MCKSVDTQHRKQRGRTAPNHALSTDGLIYGIEDKPPFGKLILFAIQMVLSVFVATVLIANICGVNVPAALVGAGLSTLAYILVTGGKSPMFISNSGAFVAPVIMALSTAGYSGVIVGGVVTFLIYSIFGIIFTKIPVSNIYKVFPSALIGAVTVVIGINLMAFIPTYLGDTGQWGLVIALITMLAIALLSHYAKGIMKILPFLLGTLIGYGCAVVLTITNICKIVDFTVFKNMTLFTMPEFAFTKVATIGDSRILISIIVVYIAFTISAMMECLSDHAALSGIIETDLYVTPGLGKIFRGEGLSNLMSSVFGGLGACSYGEGVACVGFSRVASVWVTGMAAIILGLLGFIGPVQAFIASIPSCVFAGAAIVLYGFIACSGIKMLQKTDLNKQKNLVIVSSVLSLGIGGLVLGGATISISGTALALVFGVILNLILKEKVDE